MAQCVVGGKRVFVGREEEQRKLQGFWESARAGEPQNVLLVADTGWGKTRLMQWLYEHLASSPANNGYWPKEIDPGAALRREKINPTLVGADSPNPIPYLWIAMRVPEQTDRSALPEALEAIRPHTIALLERRARELQIQNLDREALRDLRDLGMDVAGDLSGYGILKSLVQTARRVLDRERTRREGLPDLATPEANAARAQRERMDALLDLFGAFLESDNPELPTLPVVLFLDDGQWADPLSWSLIEKLIIRARANAWPLLVVVAHWRKDLPPGPGPRLDPDAPPRHLTELLDGQAAPLHWGRIDLGPAPELIAVVRQAYPDLPEDQAAIVAECADGHPLRLHGLLNLIALNTTWIEDGRLTDDAIERLRAADSMNQLAKDIFAGLEAELRTMLGWASRNGRRFLHRIVAAMAADPTFEPVLATDQCEATLDRAERQSGFTEKLSGVPLSSFTQADFHAVARNLFENASAKHQAGAVAAMRRALVEALESEVFEALSAAEQEDVLDLALVELRPPGPVDPADPAWHPWGRAAFEKFARLEAAFRWDASEALGLELAAGGAWPLEVAGFRSPLDGFRAQYEVIQRLIANQKIDAAKTLVTGVPVFVAQERWAVLATLGDVFAALADWDAALQAYTEARTFADSMIERLGRTSNSLHSLGISLIKLGDLHCRRDDWNRALSAFAEAKAVAEELIDHFGRTSENLHDLAVSWERLGLVHLAGNDMDTAAGAFAEAQALAKEILEVHGPTYEAQREFGVSWIKLGDVHASRSDWDAALEAYTRSKKTADEIVARFGRAYQSLRDLGISWDRLGDVQAARQQHDAALEAYIESKRLADEIVERYGRAYQPLRDLRLSWNKLGDDHRARQDWDAALDAYTEGKKIADEIVKRFGPAYQPLRDLGISWDKLGDGHAALEDWDAALGAYTESKSLRDEIVTQFGRTYQPLHDLADSWSKLGDVHVKRLDLVEAFTAYIEDEKLRDEIVKGFGRAYEPLRALFVSHWKLGYLTQSCERLQVARELSDEILARFPGSIEAVRDRQILDQVIRDLGC